MKTLAEINDLYESGAVKERVWDEAFDRASDTEVNEFFHGQGFVEEEEAMDIGRQKRK